MTLIFNKNNSFEPKRYCRSADFCAIVAKSNRPINLAPTP